jgi:heme-degrading monooxygenase HmoA
MIYEFAVIVIKDGSKERFEAAVEQAVPLFKRVSGCKSMRLQRSIETPLRYLMVIGWATLEDHTVGFRNPADYQVWRNLVGEHFDGAPVVEHTEDAISGF